LNICLLRGHDIRIVLCKVYCEEIIRFELAQNRLGCSYGNNGLVNIIIRALREIFLVIIVTVINYGICPLFLFLLK